MFFTLQVLFSLTRNKYFFSFSGLKVSLLVKMAIVPTPENRKSHLKELRGVALSCAGAQVRTKVQVVSSEGQMAQKEANVQVAAEVKNEEKGGENEEQEEEQEEKVVCVTSGISYIGLAIVGRLLGSGFNVRVVVDNDQDVEKLREMEMFGEGKSNRVTAVTAKLTDVESLCEAFHGCGGVFHTSAFADPAGVSGYTKCMADLEVKASENVLEACARTESIKRCVFTSSLLACIWRNDNTLHEMPPIIDHKSWSEESICRDKKLWFALGKTMAEKAAWRVAEERDVKLTTICPGLLTGPDFSRKNPTASIAYLKGVQEVYARGLLATSDVARVADAHVCVYKAMRNGASGRYICFSHAITTEEEAAKLARELELPVNRILGDNPSDLLPRFKLCDKKLSKLLSKPTRRCSSLLLLR